MIACRRPLCRIGREASVQEYVRREQPVFLGSFVLPTRQRVTEVLARLAYILVKVLTLSFSNDLPAVRPPSRLWFVDIPLARTVHCFSEPRRFRRCISLSTALDIACTSELALQARLIRGRTACIVLLHRISRTEKQSEPFIYWTLA